MNGARGYPAAVEDYVRAVYGHTEWQDAPATTTAIAAHLRLAPSTVTEMVKRLVSLGLVEHEPYGAVTLTPIGEDLALRMARRHRLIETWLVERFDYGWDEVHDEAEILEHALSDRMLDAIDAELGHPTRDPHGDPIPSATGEVLRPRAIRLADAVPGTRGTVARISDRDPVLLRTLGGCGVVLDAALDVRDSEVVVGGTPVVLDDAARTSVWIASD